MKSTYSNIRKKGRVIYTVICSILISFSAIICGGIIFGILALEDKALGIKFGMFICAIAAFIAYLYAACYSLKTTLSVAKIERETTKLKHQIINDEKLKHHVLESCQCTQIPESNRVMELLADNLVIHNHINGDNDCESFRMRAYIYGQGSAVTTTNIDDDIRSCPENSPKETIDGIDDDIRSCPESSQMGIIKRKKSIKEVLEDVKSCSSETSGIGTTKSENTIRRPKYVAAVDVYEMEKSFNADSLNK